MEQSRRDDLESLAYVLVYLRRGSLPWQDLQTKTRTLSKKRQTTVEELCSGLPPAFANFLSYTRCLRFDEDPDYDYLRQIFAQLRSQEGYDIGSALDLGITSPPTPPKETANKVTAATCPPLDAEGPHVDRMR